MKEKHTLLTSLFNIIGGMILIMFSIGSVVFSFFWLIALYRVQDPELWVIIGFLGFSIVFTVFLIYSLGHNMFQWTIIDNKKIRSRNIFKTILEVQWKDIKEVVLVMFNISGAGTAVKWIVLKDKEEDIKQYNGVMNKDTFITIRYSKRAVRVIRTYWKDKITNLDD